MISGLENASRLTALMFNSFYRTNPRRTCNIRVIQLAALQQAHGMLQASVQTNAFVMADSECFLALGMILLIGSVTIWLCKEPKQPAAPAQFTDLKNERLQPTILDDEIVRPTASGRDVVCRECCEPRPTQLRCSSYFC
jgi:hypothetical protein